MTIEWKENFEVSLTKDDIHGLLNAINFSLRDPFIVDSESVRQADIKFKLLEALNSNGVQK